MSKRGFVEVRKTKGQPVNGNDGVGITKAFVDSSYHLILELTSGKKLDTGFVRGPPGITSKGGRVTGGYSSGSGGYVNKPTGIAELDFGTGSSTATVDITGVNLVAQDSVIFCSMRIEATEDHSEDELLIDPIRVAVKSLITGAGFTIYGEMDNAPANGKYKVQWALH
jgi:hypothetical protein